MVACGDAFTVVIGAGDYWVLWGQIGYGQAHGQRGVILLRAAELSNLVLGLLWQPRGVAAY